MKLHNIDSKARSKSIVPSTATQNALSSYTPKNLDRVNKMRDFMLTRGTKRFSKTSNFSISRPTTQSRYKTLNRLSMFDTFNQDTQARIDQLKSKN